MIMDAPWYVLKGSPNINSPDNRRLRRHLPNDLPTRFTSVIAIFVILVLNFSLQVLFLKATRGFEPISYRGVLVSTHLHF
jgi:hypothetical protein